MGTFSKIFIALAFLATSCSDPTSITSRSTADESQSRGFDDDSSANLDGQPNDVCSNVRACPAGTSICAEKGCSCLKLDECGKILPCKGLLLGDVNRDSKLSAVDTTLLRRFLSRSEGFDECQRIAADVNQDARITNDDVRLLRGAIGLLIKLPAKFGDINNDKKIDLLDLDLVSAYLAHSKLLSPGQLILADMDADDQVTRMDRDKIAALVPKKCAPLALGDVSKDRELSAVDTTLLRRFLSGSEVFDECQKIAADVNQDARITSDDVRLLRGAIGLLIRLPAKFGDLNGDKKLTLSDVELITGYLELTKSLTPGQLLLADMNADDQVTTIDRDMIVTIVRGGRSDPGNPLPPPTPDPNHNPVRPTPPPPPNPNDFACDVLCPIGYTRAPGNSCACVAAQTDLQE